MSNFNPLQLALKPLFETAKNEDAIFAKEVAEKTESKKKSWEECCEYIMGEAYAYAKEHRDGSMGMAGMSDEDLMGMIKHYYDEDSIEIKKMGGASVKVATTKADKKGKGTKTGKSTSKTDNGKKEPLFKPSEQKKDNKPALSLSEMLKSAKKAQKKAEDEEQADLWSLFGADENENEQTTENKSDEELLDEVVSEIAEDTDNIEDMPDF